MDAARLEEQVAAVEAAAEACLTGSGDAAALVTQLDAMCGATVTVDVLKATSAGKRLSKVAKKLGAGTGTEASAAAAQRVVDTWSERIAQALAADGAEDSEGGRAAKRHKGEEASDPPPQEQPPPVAPLVKRPPPKLDNEARRKHRELLTAALRLAGASLASGTGLLTSPPFNRCVDTRAESEGVQGDPDWVGAQVEAELYNKYKPTDASLHEYERSGGGSSKEYKVKFRQLSFNLKDSNNPDLRRGVLLGEVAPKELLEYSPEELGSSARREENAAIREKAMWECERGQAQQASTDAFQCGKCKQRKCTYFQLQTRSADEPMTTFVTCVTPGCNNRWKFC